MKEKKKRVITGMMVAKVIAVLAFVVTVVNAVDSVVGGTPILDVLTNVSTWTGALFPAFIVFLLIPLIEKEKKDKEKKDSDKE